MPGASRFLADPYDFRPVTAGDLALLNSWIARPHVAEWWEEGFDIDDLRDPRVTHWLVTHNDQPFAFMQDYTPHGWEDHPFGYLPAGARGVDQFIGEAAMLGQGHGSGFIAQRVRALFAAGAPVVATDPHPDNARAIAAYRKAGFQVSGEDRDTQWGRIRPMLAYP
ncbi:MAG: GNAT family N-acetyltransferase [Pseudomonadota bacterium]